MSRSRSASRSRSRSASMSRSPSPSPGPEEDNSCPFLIRIFVTKGKHTSLRDFDDNRLPLNDEFHVYGSKSSTPTSLIQQLYAIFPAPYRSPVARYSFKHVYVDASEAGLYKAKELLSFSGRDFTTTVSPGDRDEAMGAQGRRVDEETLDEYGFLKGDFLSVAVSVPEPRPVRNGAPGAAGGRDPRDVREQPRRDVRSDLRDRNVRDGGDPYRSRPTAPPRGGGWGRDRSPGPPSRNGRRDSHERWTRRSRSRSPDRARRDAWGRGRD